MERQWAIEDRRRGQEDEARELQLRTGRAQAAAVEQEQRGQAFERSMLPLALKRGEDGVTRFDRDLLTQEFTNAGLADRLPDVFQRLDEQDNAALAVLNARRDAVASVFYGVLQGGNRPESFAAALEYARANDLAPPRELDVLDRMASQDPASIAELTRAVVGSSPKFASLIKPKDPVKGSPGDVFFDPDHGMRPIAAVPEKPEDPPALGSFEDYVRTKYGPRPTPEQIEAARKAYNQADDRPISITTGPRQLTQNAESSLINRYSTQWQTAIKPVKELDRQLTMMEAGLEAAQRGDAAQANEVILQTFLKVIDPTSVVREGEFWRLQQGQSLINRARAAVNRIRSGGWVTGPELEKYAQLAREIRDSLAQSQEPTRVRIGRNLDRYNIPHELVFDDAPVAPTSAAPAPRATPGGAVQMRAPDGQVYLVPADKVDEAKRRGAKVVGR